MDPLAALRLQIEWGADEALDAEPVNRLRPAAPPPPPAPAPAPSPAAEAPPVAAGRGTPAERATQAAAGARTLEALRAAIAGFDGCALRDTASHLVFAAGDPSSRLLLVGDAPGADEDRSGIPFAGAAGAYLDRMLGSIGLQRNALLLAPLIPWRPPGDRPPSPAELAICLPFLFRLIALGEPRRLVLLGSLAARAVLGPAAPRRRPAGGWSEAVIPHTSRQLPVLCSFSPRDLLRQPRDRRAAWRDLRLLRRALDADLAAK